MTMVSYTHLHNGKHVFELLHNGFLAATNLYKPIDF